MSEKKGTVLIIDDSKANILTLTHILVEDYTVLAAKNGYIGLQVAREQLPDVILLDIIMPEMDGFAVLKDLKHETSTHKIPVIFISGLSSSEDEEKGLNFGASDYIGKPFNPAIVKLRVSNQVRMLRQLQKIEEISMTDSLTGLPNRMGVELHFRNMWEKCRAENQVLSVFMMDIDNFKHFNDTYGHLKGDEVLKHVAEVLRQSFQRQTDFVGRFGGEEFIAILPNVSEEHSMKLADLIRENLQKFTRRQDDRDLSDNVTLSIGVFNQIPTTDSTIDEYVDKADKALYQAKRTGKDRAVLYTAELEHVK